MACSRIRNSTVAYMQAHESPAANILMGPTAVFEVAGGALLVLRWRARWTAIALAAYTLASAFVFHVHWRDPANRVMSQRIHFIRNLAICRRIDVGIRPRGRSVCCQAKPQDVNWVAHFFECKCVDEIRFHIFSALLCSLRRKRIFRHPPRPCCRCNGTPGARNVLATSFRQSDSCRLGGFAS